MSTVKRLLGENSNQRVINTGLTGPVNKAILNSVIGQLSDGKWENTPSMRKYWENADIDEKDGNIVIVVKDGWNSGFRGKDDAAIKSWFAGKIKDIAYDNLGYEDGPGKWDRKDTSELDYLSRSESPVTVANAYQAYEILKGRNLKNKTYAEVKPKAEVPAPAAQVAAPAPSKDSGGQPEDGSWVESLIGRPLKEDDDVDAPSDGFLGSNPLNVQSSNALQRQVDRLEDIAQRLGGFIPRGDTAVMSTQFYKHLSRIRQINDELSAMVEIYDSPVETR